MNKRQGQEGANEYHSFILRFWMEKRNHSHWRFVLVNSSTGAEKGFKELEQLTKYLQEVTEG